jgi:hypothetical protein
MHSDGPPDLGPGAVPCHHRPAELAGD